MFEKQGTIGHQVSLTFLALLQVSVGVVCEISKIAFWQCQPLFTMKWICVMYNTEKNICDVFIEMHEQRNKKYYGNHCTVQYCTVQFCFEIKNVMALFWNQGNKYSCLGISECKMFLWSHTPVTFVDILWSCFYLLKGMSVRMGHATASSASSDAVELRMQRHCEMMQDGFAQLLSFLLLSFVKLVFC